MAKHETHHNGSRQAAPLQPLKKHLTVKEAAQRALHQYAGTFRDLARYDRGEQPANPLPH